jgi:hypothetical protein
MAGAIALDWESCQFPFVLDEKPTLVHYRLLLITSGAFLFFDNPIPAPHE